MGMLLMVCSVIAALCVAGTLASNPVGIAAVALAGVVAAVYSVVTGFSIRDLVRSCKQVKQVKEEGLVTVQSLQPVLTPVTPNVSEVGSTTGKVVGGVATDDGTAKVVGGGIMSIVAGCVLACGVFLTRAFLGIKSVVGYAVGKAVGEAVAKAGAAGWAVNAGAATTAAEAAGWAAEAAVASATFGGAGVGVAGTAGATAGAASVTVAKAATAGTGAYATIVAGIEIGIKGAVEVGAVGTAIGVAQGGEALVGVAVDAGSTTAKAVSAAYGVVEAAKGCCCGTTVTKVVAATEVAKAGAIAEGTASAGGITANWAIAAGTGGGAGTTAGVGVDAGAGTAGAWGVVGTKSDLYSAAAVTITAGAAALAFIPYALMAFSILVSVCTIIQTIADLYSAKVPVTSKCFSSVIDNYKDTKDYKGGPDLLNHDEIEDYKQEKKAGMRMLKWLTPPLAASPKYRLLMALACIAITICVAFLLPLTAWTIAAIAPPLVSCLFYGYAAYACKRRGRKSVIPDTSPCIETTAEPLGQGVRNTTRGGQKLVINYGVPLPRIELEARPYQGRVLPLNYNGGNGIVVFCDG
ncbi:hypothetical protein ACIS_00675 [Anaplasma centrale str. Israel]|uniref:Uncharacterized protein n=1 Tax=Anaplasma centrale (strain Israel) TaxID=574556 RepID=D1AUM1_ANACI|nr:hypothetical protein ACIS_00675 [Anaplasma centrale str. Israel]